MAAISSADATYVPASSTKAAPMIPASAATMAAATGWPRTSASVSLRVAAELAVTR